MQLGVTGQTFGKNHLLDQDILLAAVTGFTWLVLDHEKLVTYLQQGEFDLRDLKRLFLRVQPAALDGLVLPDCSPDHLPRVEALCKEARRIGAPVLVARIRQPDERIVAYAEVARRWSTVLALAPAREPDGPTFAGLRTLVRALDHEALGWYLDTVALWRAGESIEPADVDRTVLLAVGDEDDAGRPCRPGGGKIPLRALLAPLRAGGYDSIALLALDRVEESPETLAEEGYRALVELLEAVGWAVERRERDQG